MRVLWSTVAVVAGWRGGGDQGQGGEAGSSKSDSRVSHEISNAGPRGAKVWGCRPGALPVCAYALRLTVAVSWRAASRRLWAARTSVSIVRKSSVPQVLLSDGAWAGAVWLHLSVNWPL